MIGHTINNYLIERKLGEGGMGDVYLGRHNRVDRIVAIKVLHQNLYSNERIRNRFKNEANALIKLAHPNIVRIYDYVEQENFACLIMEYIEGFTLDEYITKISGPLTAPKASKIISGILDAVQYAHENNIYHRDIKPGNIMISKDGLTVRIMDFGIAKITDSASFNATNANAQLGTPFYMSPEQVKGLPYTSSSDIYSLGVTLFEMVTGKCPYQAITNLFVLQNKIVNEPLPPTSLYYPDVPKRLQSAIIIATNKDPDQRFGSCAEFKKYLLEESYALIKPKEEINPIIPLALAGNQIGASVIKDTMQAEMEEPEIKIPRKANYKTILAIIVVCFIIVVVGIGFVLNTNSVEKLSDVEAKGDTTVYVVPATVNEVVSADTTTVSLPDSSYENRQKGIEEVKRNSEVNQEVNPSKKEQGDSETIIANKVKQNENINNGFKPITENSVKNDLMKLNNSCIDKIKSTGSIHSIEFDIPGVIEQRNKQDNQQIQIKARSEEDNCTVILSYIRKGNEFQFLNSRVL